MGNTGTRAIFSWEQGNKGLKIRGTGGHKQFWGTGNIENQDFVFGEQVPPPPREGLNIGRARTIAQLCSFDPAHAQLSARILERASGRPYTARICIWPQCHRGRKKNTDRPGLELRTPRTPCEYSDHWATEPHGRPVTISPCLIRFVPESARNHAGTDETVPLLLAARARTHTEPPNVTGEEKAHGLTGTRTHDPSHTVRALWPLSYRATRSTCDNNITGGWFHMDFPRATGPYGFPSLTNRVFRSWSFLLVVSPPLDVSSPSRFASQVVSLPHSLEEYIK